MKAIGTALLVIGLVIAVVPAYNNCTYEGKAIQTASGGSVDMKCHWTARASTIVGVVLALVGGLFILSKRRETRLMLAVIAAALGAFAIALPTALIGVCMMDALCVDVLRPTLLLLGGTAIALAAFAFSVAWRQDDSLPDEGASA